MARYKAIPSRKEEFDAFWDALLTECGCKTEEIREIFSQSDEFMRKSREIGERLQNDADRGRHEGESLEDFKKRKLLYLDMQARTINELSD